MLLMSDGGNLAHQRWWYQCFASVRHKAKENSTLNPGVDNGRLTGRELKIPVLNEHGLMEDGGIPSSTTALVVRMFGFSAGHQQAEELGRAPP